MNEDLDLLKKRFTELARKSEDGGYYTFTDFLGLAEQSALAEVMPKYTSKLFTCYGGTDGTERVMVRFGNEDEIGYSVTFPIVCIKIEPLSQKFADKLTHRDFLGALLNLGIERDTLGDIAILENIGYLFAKDDIADFITESLTRVRRTDVKARKVDEIPVGDLYRTEEKHIQISSERADAIVAKIYGLSRDDSQSLFKKHLVFVNGKICENTSYNLKDGEKVSVRGHGRFIYRGFDGISRKGKLNAKADVYV